MSRKAVQANFEALFALEKPRQRYGVVRYGSGGGAAGGGGGGAADAAGGARTYSY